MLSRASALDEAKRWIEASTMLCRYVPGGVERAEKVCWVFRISFGSGLICARFPRRMRGFLNGMLQARTRGRFSLCSVFFCVLCLVVLLWVCLSV